MQCGVTLTFRTTIISTPHAAAHLRYMAEASGVLAVVREARGLESSEELYRSLTISPDIILLDLGCTTTYPGLVAFIRRSAPQAIIVAVGSFRPGALNDAKLVDIALPGTVSEDDFVGALKSALQAGRGKSSQALFCFLPAKAGSGCSTIVLNTAAALARDSNSRVLVIDADLRSSVMTAATGALPPEGTEQILASLDELTAEQFRRGVVRWNGFDVLISKRSLETAPPDWGHYMKLLKLLQNHYDRVLVDLPELVNPATVELVRAATRNYIVCTPELPSLMLARHRLSEFDRLQLDPENVGVLVNRWHRTDPVAAEISELLGYPVSKVIPNDYGAVNAAISGATIVQPGSKLGGAYREFAASMLPSEASSGGIGRKLRDLLRI